MRCWSSNRAFSGADEPVSAVRSSAKVSGPRIGTKRTEVRVQLDPAEAARVREAQPAAVGEPQGEPIPRGIVASPDRVLKLADGVLTIQREPTGHAEAQSKDRADQTEVHGEQLPSAIGRGECCAPNGIDHLARGDPTFEPAVGHLDRLDGAPDGLVRQPPVDLDLRGAEAPAAASKACMKSAMTSSACSRPTDTRMVPGPMPLAASSSGSRFTWVVDTGCVTSVSGPPREVACWASRTDFDEPTADLQPTDHVERNERATAGHLPGSQFVLRVRRQARVADLRGGGVGLRQRGGEGQRRGGLTGDADGQGADAEHVAR